MVFKEKGLFRKKHPHPLCFVKIYVFVLFLSYLFIFFFSGCIDNLQWRRFVICFQTDVYQVLYLLLFYILINQNLQQAAVPARIFKEDPLVIMHLRSLLILLLNIQGLRSHRLDQLLICICNAKKVVISFGSSDKYRCKVDAYIVIHCERIF